MTITIITLIVLTIGNGYYLVRQHEIIKGISRKLNTLEKLSMNEWIEIKNKQHAQGIQIDNYISKIYELELKWVKFNKPLNNTKLLKLSGFKKYSKKK